MSPVSAPSSNGWNIPLKSKWRHDMWLLPLRQTFHQSFSSNLSISKKFYLLLLVIIYRILKSETEILKSKLLQTFQQAASSKKFDFIKYKKFTFYSKQYLLGMFLEIKNFETGAFPNFSENHVPFHM
jgi:hypothetical protein